MSKDVKSAEENNAKIDTEFAKPATYDFNKNTFVVTPIFNEKSAETLGTVLIRLINSE